MPCQRAVLCFDVRMGIQTTWMAAAGTAVDAARWDAAGGLGAAGGSGAAEGWDDDDTVRAVHPLEALGGVLPQDSCGALVERTASAAERRFSGADGVDARAARDCGDEDVDDAGSGTGSRCMPRLILTPGVCAVIVLVLVTALCACLVLLVKQGTALARFAQGEESGYPVSSLHAGLSTPSQSEGMRRATAQPDATRQEAESADPAQSTVGQATPGASSPGAAASSQAASTTETAPTGQTGSSQQQEVAPAEGGLVNINTATSEKLQTVKGIGPATAQKIIEYRSLHGPFSSVDELVNVDGIGAKTVQKLRGKVTV